MDSFSYESLLSNKVKVKDLYEQTWHKSFSSITKQNLNCEFKEKEMNSKSNLTQSNNSNESSFPPLTPHGRPHGRLQPYNFIDNKPNPCSGMRIKNKPANEAHLYTTGIGRGLALQKRMETCQLKPRSHFQDLPNRTSRTAPSGSRPMITAPISHQIDNMLGDVYSDAALRRSLDDSSCGRSESSGEECLGLERALSEVSLSSSSATSSLSSASGGERWVPHDALLDPAFHLRKDQFPALQ